ncbi:MAG: diguanylate cyclase [Anaerolineaceae bacterium]
MRLIFTPYSYSFLIAIVVSLIALVVILLRANVPGKKWMVLAMLAITIWNLCAMLDISSTTLEGRLIWSRIEYLGANTTAPLLLLFFLNYPSVRIRLTKFQIALLFFLPTITITMAMTNEWHSLFWTGFTPLPGIINGYDFQHGPFYWLALAFNYSCGTITVFQIIRNTIQFRGIYRLQSITLLIFSVFPYAAGLAYSLGTNPFPGLDILPLAFSLGGLGIVISVVFMRLFNLVPVGRTVLVENMQDGLIVLNSSLMIVDINPAAQKLLAPAVIRVGDPIQKAGESISTHFKMIASRVEIELDNEIPRILEIKTSPLTDQMGNQNGTVGIIRDITELSQMRQKLQEMATHDALTGLPNRTLFYERFELTLANAKRNKKSFAILSLDLDHFKEINDNLGHPIGDAVLVEIANRLTSTLRATDTAARFGGDEFVILLWEITDRTDAIKVAKKLLEMVRKPYLMDGQQLKLTASIGIVFYPENGKEIRELIKHCDEAMYRAKESGRNAYHYAGAR